MQLLSICHEFPSEISQADNINILALQSEQTEKKMTDRFKTSFEKTSSEYSQSGTGTSEIRYKKALKQINRLVSLSTSLKKEVQLWQENYHGLEKQYQGLLAKYNQVLSRGGQLGNGLGEGGAEEIIDRSETARVAYNQHNSSLPPIPILTTETHPTPNKITSSYLYSPESQPDLPPAPPNPNSNSQQIYIRNMERLQKQNQQFVQQVNYQRKYISELESKITSQDQKIGENKYALQHKHLRIIQLEGICGELSAKLFRIQKELNQIREREKGNGKGKEENIQRVEVKQDIQEPDKGNIELLVAEELMKQKKRVEQLQSKLKLTEQWSKQIQTEYETLRKHLILSQHSVPSSNSSSSLILPTSARMPSEPSSPPKKALMLSVKANQELAQLRKEYNEKKQKYKMQINKLREENQGLNGRVASMLRLIHKQQEYIESFAPAQGR